MLVSIQAKWRAIRRKVADVGVLATVGIVVREVARSVVGREYRLYEIDLAAVGDTAQDQRTDLVYRATTALDQLSSAERASVSEYATEQYLHLAAGRMDKGWTLNLAVRNGELAGAAWTCPTEAEFASRLARPFGEADIAIVDCWTIPAHRGHRVFPSLLRFIIERSREAGLDRALIEVEEKNIASIKGIERAGFGRSETT